MRLSPFTQADILGRESWPEIQAGLRGPSSYDELGVLNHKQRGELVRLARVGGGTGKAFRRRGSLLHQWLSPSEATSRPRRPRGRCPVDAANYRHGRGLCARSAGALWDWRAEAAAADSGLVRTRDGNAPPPGAAGQGPRSITPDLSYHAFALQRIAGAHSGYLAADRGAMQRWLAEALVVSGERPVGKNTWAAYFEQLMLKQ
jgi:hypothetical protein